MAEPQAARVSRAWLQAQLGVAPEDPERWVDILHARYCAEPPASRELLGRTLAVSAATVGQRERAALAVLRALGLEALTGADALHPDDRLYAALAAQPAPEAEPAAEPPEAAAAPPVAFTPAPELAAAVQDAPRRRGRGAE